MRSFTPIFGCEGGYHDLMRPGLTLFKYLHLAAEKELTLSMVEHSVTGIAYETVEEATNGILPCLYTPE